MVSTRTDRAIGGNSFTPTRLKVPGGEMSPQKRLVEVRDRMAARRAEVSGQGMLATLAGVANLLPTSLEVSEAAAPDATLNTIVVVFGIAAVLVLPSLGFLYVLDQRGIVVETDEPSTREGVM